MSIIKSLTVGPIVGHVDTHHGRIWGRGEYESTTSDIPRRSFGIARIKKAGEDYGSPRFFKMNPNFDMTGIVCFTGLTSDTKYIYQIGCFFSDKELNQLNSNDQWDWKNAQQGEFATASNNPYAPREFIFGSCRYLLKLFGGNWFDDRGDKTFRSILNQQEDGRGINKLLMIGDQIYADDLNVLHSDQQLDKFFSRYRDTFSQPYIRKLMSRVSTYMILDDHEIEDNWPSKADSKDMMLKYPSAIHSYQAYQASHSPVFSFGSNGNLEGTPDRFYYRFNDGCCEFFVTDSRTERLPDKGEMISERQMKDLLEWLDNNSGKVKFIVTSVPFFPDMKKPDDDKWSGYKQQRDQIIEHIRTQQIKKVVFLSGDVHCSMAAELDISRPGDLPLKIYSIISSPFYWPYPHMKPQQFQLTGFVSSLEDEREYTIGEVSEVFSGDNFSRVRVSNSEIEIEVYERKGKLEQSIRYEF